MQNNQVLGGWDSIHITAAWADEPNKIIFFSVWIRNLVNYLPFDHLMLLR